MFHGVDERVPTECWNSAPASWTGFLTGREVGYRAPTNGGTMSEHPFVRLRAEETGCVREERRHRRIPARCTNA